MGKNSSSLIIHIFNVSLKEKFIFVKLFKTYFSSDIMASIPEFECQSTDNFVIRV